MGTERRGQPSPEAAPRRRESGTRRTGIRGRSRCGLVPVRHPGGTAQHLSPQGVRRHARRAPRLPAHLLLRGPGLPA